MSVYQSTLFMLSCSDVQFPSVISLLWRMMHERFLLRFLYRFATCIAGCQRVHYLEQFADLHISAQVQHRSFNPECRGASILQRADDLKNFLSHLPTGCPSMRSFSTWGLVNSILWHMDDKWHGRRLHHFDLARDTSSPGRIGLGETPTMRTTLIRSTWCAIRGGSISPMDLGILQWPLLSCKRCGMRGTSINLYDPAVLHPSWIRSTWCAMRGVSINPLDLGILQRSIPRSNEWNLNQPNGSSVVMDTQYMVCNAGSLNQPIGSWNSSAKYSTIQWVEPQPTQWILEVFSDDCWAVHGVRCAIRGTLINLYDPAILQWSWIRSTWCAMRGVSINPLDLGIPQRSIPRSNEWNSTNPMDLGSLQWRLLSRAWCAVCNAWNLNQLIWSCNTSVVMDTQYMVCNAGSLNQPIGSWNSSVTTVEPCVVCNAKTSINPLASHWSEQLMQKQKPVANIHSTTARSSIQAALHTIYCVSLTTEVFLSWLIEVPQNKTLLQQWPVLVEDTIETFHTKKQPFFNQKQEVVSFDNKTNMQLCVEDLDDGVRCARRRASKPSFALYPKHISTKLRTSGSPEESGAGWKQLGWACPSWSSWSATLCAKIPSNTYYIVDAKFKELPRFTGWTCPDSLAISPLKIIWFALWFVAVTYCM